MEMLDEKQSPTPTPKYLTYLPHSGLSNQRIELANALLMASILDRTLIIPPAFLGRVIGWNRKWRSMAQSFEWRTTPKDFDTLCPTIRTSQRPSSYVESNKCQSYHDSGVIQWSDLHDLNSLRPYVSFQYSNIISLDHLTSSLGLCGQEVRYDWRVYEDDKVRHDLHRSHRNYVLNSRGRKEYFHLTSWKDWQQRPEKLLYLGSIFGVTRLNVVHSDHLALKNRIAKALIYRMDSPLGKTASLIVEEYLARSAYLAVHFRTADKMFSKDLDIHMRNTSQKIEQTLALPQQAPFSFCNLTSTVITPPSSNSNIYMATDHTHPRQRNSTLAPWFEQYPCTITLNDIPSSYFKHLDSFYDLIQPTKPLKRFLMPLVDSMVAAKASQVYLTPKSTFSNYIRQLHDAWLPEGGIST
ncbi:hypothetical protein BCR42DRAFT_476188 [Absidia repens]|uniref:GDP-fucose protein O-fucosyltransferase-domain-containing protein n=1 Tax=Absidia repens TaxID=90262 RepID=A0A1X2IQM7_9FUNG|nr:hypothetical protein BCR42DRAFT_476188 [Absidia repens]